MSVARRTVHGAVAAGVLATGLVLGGGVASADTCTSTGGVQYTGPASAITDGVCDAEAILSGALSPVDTTPSTPTTTKTPPPSTTTDDPEPSAPVVTVPSVTVPKTVVVPPVLVPKSDTTDTTQPDSTQPGTTKPGTTQPPAGSPPSQTTAVGGAAVSPPAAAVIAAAPTLGVLPVSGTALNSLFTAPTAFSPVALSTPYNPGLLFSAPLGSPLRTLAVGDPASAVTTASQVQAMALDGLPRGIGIPAVIGVLILSGLGGLALRRRLLTRPTSTAASS